MSRFQELRDRAARQVLEAIRSSDAEAMELAGRKLWYVGVGAEVVHAVDGHMIVASANDVKAWEIPA